MAAKQLAQYVTVHRDGEAHHFGPGDDVPVWAVDAITNPNVWAEPEAPAQPDVPDVSDSEAGAGETPAPAEEADTPAEPEAPAQPDVPEAPATRKVRRKGSN